MSLLKELASALRSRLVISVVPTSMGGSRIYDATLAGKRVGSIRVDDRFAHDLFGNITGKKTPKISRSDVEERFRGMGIGKKLYSEVIKREGRVMSDSSVSGEARRVYESLKKNKNIKIRTLPAIETGGGLVGRDGVYQHRPPGLSNGFGGRPVFAVQWKGRKDFSAKLRLRELARGDFLRQVIGYSDLVPARRSVEAAKGAGKLRYYRGDPVGKEIGRIRKEIAADPQLSQASRYKDTPGLTVIDEYDEAYDFPKRSRDTKYVIDNLNKHAARGKTWAVKKGALGQPIVKAQGINRILSAKLRLRELSRFSQK